MNQDPVLNRFATEIRNAYGERLDRLVLFGSRARGGARPDSDYDIAAFLKGGFGFGAESETLALIETDILYDTGAVINTLPLHCDTYESETSFMCELRRDGIDL